MHGFTRSFRTALVAGAGVATALAVAGLTQAAPGGSSATTTPTSTTPTATTPTTTTKTTTTTKSTTTTTTTTAKPKATTRKITCRATLIAVITPIDNAENFGNLKCSTPFGKGVQHDSAKITRPTPTTGSFNGSFKLFFNEGTLRGTYKTSFTATGGKATYDGTMKVSSGTGDFLGVKGTGTMTGTSDDLVKTPMTEKLTLTLPAGQGGGG